MLLCFFEDSENEAPLAATKRIENRMLDKKILEDDKDQRHKRGDWRVSQHA